MRLSALVLVCSLPLAAGEVAVLSSGFRIPAEKIERVDNRVRLHTRNGVIEVEPEAIAAIELEPLPDARVSEVVSQPLPTRERERKVPPKTPKELVTEAAARHGLPPEIVHAVAAVESAYQPNAISPKGAIGVMQLMPQTAETLGADPRDVGQNIDAGTRLLRDLRVKYENDPNPVKRALAAYNAGEGAVERYKGVPPYVETQQYVDKVLERYWKQVNVKSTSTPATPAQTH